MLATYPSRIGDLAATLRINPRTIRYYERIGLLPEPERLPSGYRQYSAHDAERLRFILKAKTIGLTLDEIREILALRDAGQPPCEHVATMIDEKVVAIEAQIRVLRNLKDELLKLSLVAKATTCCGGSVCSIIEGHERPLATTP